MRGVNIMTALEAEMLGEPDDRQLAYAAAQGRAIYSFNVGDFCDFTRSGWRKGDHMRALSWQSSNNIPLASR